MSQRGACHQRGSGLPCKGAVFTPFSLMLIGLACLVLHLAGISTGWRVRR